MNIFYLHHNAGLAARYHCDKHVVKMIVEYAQLMSTAHRMIDGHEITVSRGAPWRRQRQLKRWVFDDRYKNGRFYAATHVNHPSNVWVRKSRDNYIWLRDMWIALCMEYTRRYNRSHKTFVRLSDVLYHPPQNLIARGFTPPPQAMPDKYKRSGSYGGIDHDTVMAYRDFYKNDKVAFATWKNGSPHWWPGYEVSYG